MIRKILLSSIVALLLLSSYVSAEKVSTDTTVQIEAQLEKDKKEELKPFEINYNFQPTIDPLNITDQKINGKDPMDWIWSKVVDFWGWAKSMAERILPALPIVYGIALIAGTILGIVISKKIIKWVLLSIASSLTGVLLIMNGYEWYQALIKWLSS